MKRFRFYEWWLLFVPIAIIPLALWVRHVRSPVPLPVSPQPSPTPKPLTYSNSSAPAYEMRVTPDGKRLVTLSPINTTGTWGIRVWNAHTLRYVFGFGEQTGQSSLALTPDGSKVVTGWTHSGGRKCVHVYDLASGQQVIEMAPGEGSSEFAVSPDSRQLALGFGGRLELHDINTGRLLRTFKCRRPDAGAVSPTISPNGKHIAFVEGFVESCTFYTGGGQDEIELLSLRTGKRIRVLSWPRSSINCVTFSPDGTLVAALVQDWKKSTLHFENINDVDAAPDPLCRVVLWNAQSGRVVRVLPTRIGMHKLEFSPNGRWLAAASWGEGIEVWQASDGKVAVNRRGSTPTTMDGRPYNLGDSVECIAFTPDSRSLLYPKGAGLMAHVALPS